MGGKNTPRGTGVGRLVRHGYPSRVTKSILRRFVVVFSGALAFVATSAAVASATPQGWQTAKVTGLALVDELVLIPLGIAVGVAAVVWTVLTAKERATAKVATRSGGKG